MCLSVGDICNKDSVSDIKNYIINTVYKQFNMRNTRKQMENVGDGGGRGCVFVLFLLL